MLAFLAQHGAISDKETQLRDAYCVELLAYASLIQQQSEISRPDLLLVATAMYSSLGGRLNKQRCQTMAARMCGYESLDAFRNARRGEKQLVPILPFCHPKLEAQVLEPAVVVAQSSVARAHEELQDKEKNKAAGREHGNFLFNLVSEHKLEEFLSHVNDPAAKIVLRRLARHQRYEYTSYSRIKQLAREFWIAMGIDRGNAGGILAVFLGYKNNSVMVTEHPTIVAVKAPAALLLEPSAEDNKENEWQLRISNATS